MLVTKFGEISGTIRRISLIGLSTHGDQAHEKIGWLVRDTDNWKIHLDERLEALAPSGTWFDFLLPLIVGEIREEMANKGLLPHSRNVDISVPVEFGRPVTPAPAVCIKQKPPNWLIAVWRFVKRSFS